MIYHYHCADISADTGQVHIIVEASTMYRAIELLNKEMAKAQRRLPVRLDMIKPVKGPIHYSNLEKLHEFRGK